MVGGNSAPRLLDNDRSSSRHAHGFRMQVSVWPPGTRKTLAAVPRPVDSYSVRMLLELAGLWGLLQWAGVAKATPRSQLPTPSKQ